MRNLFTKSRAGAEIAEQIFNIGTRTQNRELESAALMYPKKRWENGKWAMIWDISCDNRDT
jgi:hypothetical protein